MTTTKTICPYCGVGCGVLATTQADGSIKIKGDPDHPANYGRLCSKGAQLGETLDLEGRVLQPLVNGETQNWDQALDTVTSRLQTILKQHGPDSVAFYVSAQLLSEDYYVANKLMKGGFGTANIDTNSRLCMSSAVAGHKRAFGSDTVPGRYEDFEQADLIILTGSNTAWCHPVLYQRIKAAKRARPQLKVVVIDPRRTATCEIADLHLALKSSTDTWLFQHLLVALHQHQTVDSDYIQAHTEGYEAALQEALNAASDADWVAQHCGLQLNDVLTLVQWFVETEKTITLFSQGINQSSSGTDKINSIINCHLASGRIGKPGMGPFSMTGQPNAMGGREIGALSNQLAAHMDFAPEDVDRVQRFWGSENICSQPGIKAIELFQKIREGEVKAIWIMATNPVVSFPDANLVREALQKAELVIVSDCVLKNDTIQQADIVLPAISWAEKDGTITNSERCISRQRGFLDWPGEARPDWWIVSQVGKRMGFQGFDFSSNHAVYQEMAALSGFENDGQRDFDISATAGLSALEYDQLEPFYWPQPKNPARRKERFFADGHFYTDNHKARFIAVKPQLPQSSIDAEFPLALNTGRVRDQWHTMTRTGKSPRLSRHIYEPYVEIHPDDAATRGLTDRQLVQVQSQRAQLKARLKVSAEQRKGAVFVPIHWNDQFSAEARVGALIAPYTDPFSGQPEFKFTPVQVKALETQWFGVLFSRMRLTPPSDYWTAIRRNGFWQYEMAGGQSLQQIYKALVEVLDHCAEAMPDSLYFHDSGTGARRLACLNNQQLQACLMLSPADDLPDRNWINQLFEQEQIEAADRLSILSGLAPRKVDLGDIICSCYNVGEGKIRQCIKDGAQNTDEIGKRCEAGTNCGSCLPEIQKMLEGNN